MAEQFKDLSELHLRVGGDRAAVRAVLAASLAAAVPVELDPDEGWESAVAALSGPGGCDGHCPAAESLREQVAQDKAERELLRAKIVSPGEALALIQLVYVAASARSLGKDLVPIYVPDVASRAGVSDSTMTRALNQVRRWQADPTLRLPFTVRDEPKGGKLHVRLVLPPADPAMCVEDATNSPRRAMVLALLRMPRDPGRKQHGGDHRCPRHPDATIRRTRSWACTVEGCGWVYQDVAILGRPADRSAPNAGPDQDGPVGRISSTLPDQDGPVGLNRDRPVGDDRAPRPLRPVPGWTPPRLAPAHHVADGLRRRKPSDPTPGMAP